MASITQTGPRSWRALIRRKGHKQLCRTFRTEREARSWAAKAEAELLAGRPAEAALTVAAAVEEFRALRETGKRPVRPQSTEEYMLRHLADPDGIGRVRVDALTPQRLAEWCRTRHDDGAGPCTVGMEISKLATVLRYAAISLHTVLPDVVGAAMPLLNYSGLVGTAQHRDRRPTRAELEAVLENLTPQMQDFVRFAIATAMRRGEICRIRWADVDEDRRLILVRDRKHPRKKVGNHQQIPLTDKTGFDAWQILQRQPRVDERIFPVSTEYASDAFTAACRMAGVENLHLHDMRHEGTSRLFEAGLSIEQVPLITGHADWRSLKRYTNLRPESVHAPDPGAPRRP